MDVKEILNMVGGVFQCFLPLIFGLVTLMIFGLVTLMQVSTREGCHIFTIYWKLFIYSGVPPYILPLPDFQTSPG